MRQRLLTILIFLVVSVSSFAQKNSYYKRVFVDAEYFLLYEEYRDALPLYLELHKAYPTNNNYIYRIALCYLNISNQKDKSLKYFDIAIKNTTKSYQEGFFTEKLAPIEAFLYYGKALRIHHQFDKADSLLNFYKHQLEADNANTKEVDKELESIKLARELIDNPKNHIIEPVGRNVNTRNTEIYPVSDSTGRTLVYTSEQKFYNAILISHRDSNYWKNPTNLNTQLLADGTIRTVGMSPGGNVLILARNDNDIYNLYFSHYDKDKKQFAPITKFPKEINSKSGENYGSLTPNADTLFFSSNRPGGYGGYDLYISIKNAEGGWSMPVNLGSKINTPADEIAPFVTKNGRKLFFSSNGHRTMGGFDLFYANKGNDGWQEPINFGYPLNSCDDDTYLFPIDNGDEGFFHREMEKSQGSSDLYHVIIEY